MILYPPIVYLTAGGRLAQALIRLLHRRRGLLFVILLLLYMLPVHTQNSTSLTWAPATDDVSPQSALIYEVRQSISPNITTPTDIEANGLVVMPPAGATGTTISGLAYGTTYYFNVLVQDEAGNKAAYQMVSVTTPSLTSPSIITQPISVTIKRGQNATFSVVAGGTLPLSYQWFMQNTAIYGINAPGITLYSVPRSYNNYKFYVLVSNSAGSVKSVTVTLHVK